MNSLGYLRAAIRTTTPSATAVAKDVRIGASHHTEAVTPEMAVWFSGTGLGSHKHSLRRGGGAHARVERHERSRPGVESHGEVQGVQRPQRDLP